MGRWPSGAAPGIPRTRFLAKLAGYGADTFRPVEDLKAEAALG
ncbi:hypothetical protein [Methanothrix sp.]|nr:hypothetical protein [Methanothrix sp.]